MIVLLDDGRNFISPPRELLTLRTSAAALAWLETLTPESSITQFWFDHDLGMPLGVKDTTIPVLRRLEELCFYGTAPQILEVVVHTSNPVGGKELATGLSRYFPTHRVAAGDYLIKTG